MTLQQLQYVVALDTHRHFVRAAESCFVAQPTLTIQVKKLEEEISLLIFDRKSNPLKPTPMGSVFIERAREILRQTESLKALVNDDRESLSGFYRLGIIPTAAPYLLPLFLKDFCDAHPEVRFEIQEMTSETIIESLKRETLDIGLLAGPLKEPRLKEITLFHEPFWAYAHQDSQVASYQEIESKDLSGEELWLLNQGHCFRNQMLNVCQSEHKSQVHPGFSFESGSIETLKKMVKNNGGYTLVPELAIDRSTDESYLIPFSDPIPSRRMSLLVANTFTKQGLLTALRRSIIEAVPDSFIRNQRFITMKWR